MKKSLLLIFAIFLLAVPALAAEDTDDLVELHNAVYNRSDGMYHYTVESSGAEILTNIVDGMVTTEPVCFEIPTGVTCQLYYEGRQVTNPDYTNLTVPGRYLLDVSGSTQSYQALKFTIVNSVTGILDEYRMPVDFEVREVRFNGQSISSGMSSVDLMQEGKYEITYYCRPTLKDYRLDITIDHTPPTLALEAVVDDLAKGPVDLSDLEEWSSLYVEHNGKAIHPTRRLSESGAYVVTVTDRAGNSTTYKFRIQFYFNISSLAFFIMIVVAVAAVSIYLVIYQKRMRIR